MVTLLSPQPWTRLLVSVTARAVCALVAVCTLAVIADARGRPEGPGPFDRITIGRSGLTFEVRGRAFGAVRFSGAVSIAASDGSDLVSFGSTPRLFDGGAKLEQGGTIAGMSPDEYFADGAVRLIELRNGNGGTTLMVVRRAGSELVVERIARGDSRPLAYQSVTIDGVDARADSEATFRLPKKARRGRHRTVVVALGVPRTPSDASEIFVNAAANGAGGSVGYVPYTPIRVGDTAAFLVFDLPPDEYTIDVTYSATLRPSPTLDQRLTTNRRLEGTVLVDAANLFVIDSLPELPKLVETPVSVEGFEQIEGVAGQSRYLSVTLSHGAEPFAATVSADVSFTTSFHGTLQLPAGEYAASGTVDLGSLSAGMPAALRVPSVVRVAGTLLDPALSLAPSPGQRNTLPRHAVYLNASGSASPRYFGIARLSGFQRGFKAYVPQGTVATISGSLEVRVGDPVPDNVTSENPTGTLALTISGGPRTFDGDTNLEVPVPALPRSVTLRGRILRSDGTPARSAYVQAYGGSLTGIAGGFRALVNADRKGRFTLRLLPGSAYSLYVVDFE